MMKLLILLVIVVGIIAVAQLAKVYRLSAQLRGKRQEDISEAELPWGILTFIICLTYAMNSLFTAIQVDLHIL